MDANHFDFLAMALGTWSTRRTTFTLLAGLGLGSLASRQAAAKKSGRCNLACSACTECIRGKCKKKNGKKTCKRDTCRPAAAGALCTLSSGEGGACQNGTCVTNTVCPDGLTNCLAGCTDLMSDEGSCGTCGAACAANEACQAGSCVPTAICPATTTGLCTSGIRPCSAPADECFCGQSSAGQVVCVTTLGASCKRPTCSTSATCPHCTADADCAVGSACVDISGDGCGCPAGVRICLKECPRLTTPESGSSRGDDAARLLTP